VEEGNKTLAFGDTSPAHFQGLIRRLRLRLWSAKAAAVPAVAAVAAAVAASCQVFSCESRRRRRHAQQSRCGRRKLSFPRERKRASSPSIFFKMFF